MMIAHVSFSLFGKFYEFIACGYRMYVIHCLEISCLGTWPEDPSFSGYLLLCRGVSGDPVPSSWAGPLSAAFPALFLEDCSPGRPLEVSVEDDVERGAPWFWVLVLSSRNSISLPPISSLTNNSFSE